MTEALADLDAALDKELAGDQTKSDEDQVDDEDEDNGTAAGRVEVDVVAVDSSKVEQLEQQCRSLENELDCVKGDISERRRRRIKC